MYMYGRMMVVNGEFVASVISPSTRSVIHWFGPCFPPFVSPFCGKIRERTSLTLVQSGSTRTGKLRTNGPSRSWPGRALTVSKAQNWEAEDRDDGMNKKHTFSTSGKCTRPSLRFRLLSGCTLYPLGPKTFTQSSVLGLLTSVRAMLDFGCPFDMVDMRSLPPTTAVILFATVRLAHYHHLVIQLIYVLNDVRDTLLLCTHHQGKAQKARFRVFFGHIRGISLPACSHPTAEKPSRSELLAQSPYHRPRHRANTRPPTGHNDGTQT